MGPLHPRHRETQELISRLQARRARRRRLRLWLTTAVAALVVILAVVAAAVLASGTSDQPTATTPVALSTSATTGDGPPSTTSATSTAPPSSHVNTTEGRPSTTHTANPSTTASSAPLKVVVIDPGHQARPNLEREPIGPGSQRTKAKVSSGTSGVVTGMPESELNLAIGLKLRDALEAESVRVIMTRTTQEVDLSNSERARIANEAKADLFIRIHADGSTDPAVRGIHTLYPASIPGWTDDIAAASKEAAVIIQRELIKATGARDRGLNERKDLTGFNWSDVPVVLPEIGYMTNPTEDRLLATDAYRDRIVKGLVRAILEFLGIG